MKYRDLGSTGLKVSELGFGCGNVGGLLIRGEGRERASVVARALEAGVTYFDTAPSYGDGRSEQSLGRVLRDLGAWNRVVVGTKLRIEGPDMADPVAAVRASLQASLGRLGRDHVDLVQLHNRVGPDDVPAAEVMGAVADALQQAVSDGLTRHAGITAIGEPAQLHEIVRSGRIETIQSYFNVLNPSAGHPGAAGGSVDFDGIIDTAAQAGIGVLAIRVMAAGALSGSAERAANAAPAGGAMVQGGDFDEDIERARRLQSVSEEAGLEGTTELGFRFVLSKAGVSTVLVGFSDMGQLESALRWQERGGLEAEVIERVVALAG